MQLSAALGCSLIVALLPWTSALQEGGLRAKPAPSNIEARQARMTEQIVGAWQLVTASVGGSTLSALDAAGYMVVQEDYLAIEMHLVMPTSYAVERNQPFFQSGIRRWRFAGDFQLVTSALIGCTNINIVERWDFDPPGTRTTFEMVLNEATLVLERPGDSRLVFRKLPRLPFPGDAAEALEPAGRASGGR